MNTQSLVTNPAKSLCSALMVIALCASTLIAKDKSETSDEKAWGNMDCLSTASLSKYLKKFPKSTHAADATAAITLLKTLDDAKNDLESKAVAIPFSALGDRWENRSKRRPEVGIVGYKLEHIEKPVSGVKKGWFLPSVLSGGKTSGARSLSMDELGIPAAPTGAGSIIVMTTDGYEYVFPSGTSFKTLGKNPIYFGIVAGKGLVHIGGGWFRDADTTGKEND